LAERTQLALFRNEDLKLLLEDSFKNYYIVAEKGKKEEYQHYYIKFLNTQIELSSWMLGMNDKEEDKVAILKILTESTLYKLLL